MKAQPANSSKSKVEKEMLIARTGNYGTGCGVM